jgi:hypothetical protein
VRVVRLCQVARWHGTAGIAIRREEKKREEKKRKEKKRKTRNVNNKTQK